MNQLKFPQILFIVIFIFGCKKDCNNKEDNSCKTSQQPFAHYTFDGNVNDVSGNQLHGKIVGQVTLTKDRKGQSNKAYKFSGYNSYIEIAHSKLFNTCNFSFTAWMRADSFKTFENPKAAHNEYSGLFSKLDPNISSQNGVTSIASRNYLRFQAKNSDETFIDYGNKNVSLNTGAWHHVAYVYDQGQCFIYLDSILVGTGGIKTNGKKIKWTDQPAYIGMTYWFPSRELIKSFFCGAIDDVRLYNRAISAQEVSTLAKF